MNKICHLLISLVALLISACVSTAPPEAAKPQPLLSQHEAGGVILTNLGGDKGDVRLSSTLKAVSQATLHATLDEEEQRLRDDLVESTITIERNGHRIRIIMPGDESFKVNSAALIPGFSDTLDSIALILRDYKATLIEVAGYTDNKGSNSHNLKLSELRAASVIDYLATQGIDPGHMFKIGYGKLRPIADNSTEAGRAKNRRVEITVKPITA